MMLAIGAPALVSNWFRQVFTVEGVLFPFFFQRLEQGFQH
jgi:hypothetical protein